MIHSTPTGASFSFPRPRMGRVGDVTSALVGGGIGAAVSLATTGVSLWMNSIQLSHNADSATTAIANGLATQLTNLKNAYLAEAATCASQRAALDAFDNALVWFQSPSGCGNPGYGAAGNRCISERAFPGAIYSYIDQIRDPIANDPRLQGQGCDTGASVILPSADGTYQQIPVTATGGSAVTGQPVAAAIAAAALSSAAATGSPAAGTISPLYLALGIGAAFLIAGKL